MLSDHDFPFGLSHHAANLLSRHHRQAPFSEPLGKGGKRLYSYVQLKFKPYIPIDITRKIVIFRLPFPLFLRILKCADAITDIVPEINSTGAPAVSMPIAFQPFGHEIDYRKPGRNASSNPKTQKGTGRR